MIIDIIVQARTGSTRLPGKVLMPIMGRPMIWYTLESLRRVAGRRELLLLIPDGDADLVSACPNFASLSTGPEHDVAERFLRWVGAYPSDAFVRICGDSPVIDWRLVDQCVKIFKEGTFDLVSNVGGGYPPGQQVEVVGTAFFLANRDRLDREHVTKTFYRTGTPGEKITVLASPASDEPSLVVDTQEDFDRLTRVIEKAKGKPWEYDWRQLQEFAR